MSIRVSAKEGQRHDLMCRIFGHRIAGYGGRAPYGQLSKWAVIDNVGVEHVTVTSKCDRCGDVIDVIQFHRLPTNPSPSSDKTS